MKMNKLAFLLFAALLGCTPCPKVSKKVSKVGGCDKYGDCGVLLDDGSKARAYFPVEGQEIRVCRE